MAIIKFFRITVFTVLFLSFSMGITFNSAYAQSTPNGEIKLAILGENISLSELNNEEKEAYDWAISTYNAEYLSFEDINDGTVDISDYDVIWWHYDDTFDDNYSLPANAVTNQSVEVINDFVSAGGGLFLSGFAPQFVVDMGIQSKPPNEIVRDNKVSGEWGFYQIAEGHPIFDGMQNPFATVSSGINVDNTICWWTSPSDFDGTWLTDLEWRTSSGPNIVSSGEYNHGEGKVVVVGAGAFEWHYEQTNEKKDNLEQFTQNIITYLKPISDLRVGFLVNNKDNIAGDTKVAMDWLQSNYLTKIIEFADIESNGLPSGMDALWWHHTSSSELPETALKEKVIADIKASLFNGLGIKLTGFATQYVNELGLSNGPDVVERYDMTPEGTSINVRYSRHRIFDALPNNFKIRSDDSSVNYDSYWSSASGFSGQWLASDNRSENVAIGTLQYGTGKLLVIGSEAYNWSSSVESEYFANFERLADNSFDYLSTTASKIINGLVMHFPLDGETGQNIAYEKVSEENVIISNNYDDPEWVPAPTGNGLRLDGYSTWITSNESLEQLSGEEITVELFTSLEVYPPRNSAFINNYQFPNKGYFLGIEPHGAWYFAVSINGGWHTVWGDGPLPKREWSHLAGVYKKGEGLKLYRNGELVGTQETPKESVNLDYENPIMIGRDIHSEKIAAFHTGVLNGIVDDVRIYNRAKTSDQIVSSFNRGDMSVPVDLKIPESRYEDDPHRPEFHAMPPAHWANEPHGLMYNNGRYHLFYQYNPSGPYWSHIHWGHTSSSNLVEWKDHPVAIAPEPGYDSYGVWSGDAVSHNGKIHAFYTAVDGARAGVSLATMNDYGDFEKHPENPLFYLPPGDYQDFRDPYLWKHSDGWYLTIGTGYKDGEGGVSLLYWSSDLINWEFRGELFGNKNPSETGEYWEMPVFTHLKNGKHFFGITHLPIGKNNYWIGSWEDEKFVPDSEEPVDLDLINRFLSPTITHTPDGRIIAIGIIPNHISSEFAYELGWEHVFSFPREWYLDEVNNSLGQKAAEELKQLRGNHYSSGPVSLNDSRGNVLNWQSKKFEMIAEFQIESADQVGVELRATENGSEVTRIYYDQDRSQIVVDLSKASKNGSTPGDIRSGKFNLREGEDLKLHVFVDKSVIEVFVNDRKALATRVFPTSLESNHMNVFASGGSAFIRNVDMWELDLSGSMTDIFKEEKKGVPGKIKLNKNYPNPFNPATNISFEIPRTMEVEIEVFNLLGQHVSTLVRSRMRAGYHEVPFDAGALSSGIYFYRLKAGDVIKTGKMTLLK